MDNKEALAKHRDIRARLLQALPQNHFIRSVPADGNCLFHAVSKALRRRLNLPLSHICLRSVCVHEIRTNNAWRHRFFDQQDLNGYTHSMSQDATYGDELCIQAMASAFSLNIQVFTPEYGTLSFGQTDDPTILLAYNGHNHYDVVLPKQANSPSAPTVESANIPCATSMTLEVTPDQTAKSHIAEASSIQPSQTDDNGSLLIISANVTSLRKNWSLLRHLSAKAFFCQEITLNQQGQNSMLRTLKSDNFHCVLGKPCGYKLSGSQIKFSLWNATSGGLATIAPCTQPIQKVMCTTDAFRNGRCSLTWIPEASMRLTFMGLWGPVLVIQVHWQKMKTFSWTSLKQLHL